MRRFFAALVLPREAAQLLDDGDFMSRFREVGQPEIDRLIRLYNRMSDRLRDERVRLQEQQQFLSQILAVSPLGILVLDFDGRVAYVNPSGERLLQQPASQLLGASARRSLGGALAEALTACSAQRVGRRAAVGRPARPLPARLVRRPRLPAQLHGRSRS